MSFRDPKQKQREEKQRRKRRAPRVNIEAYLRNLRRAWRHVYDVLEATPPEQREKLIMQRMGPSETRKLGGIPSFSLPALLTCTMTPFCDEWCYALKGLYASVPSVLEKRLWNILATFYPEFPEVLAEKLRKYKIVRLHDSGDIYWLPMLLRRMEVYLGVKPDELSKLLGIDVEKLPPYIYVEQLAKLADLLPNTRIYMYTRAWLNPELWRWIEKLLLPKKNVVVWLSVDPSMPSILIERAEEIAKKYPNVGVAYTALPHPEAYVCPMERCEECLYCPMMRGKRVYFELH